MNSRALILYFAAIIIGISSCKKGNDDTAPVVGTTFLNVINAGADTLNFYQNGTRLNNTSNLYPLGSLGYMPVSVGLQNYQLKKAGSSNALVNLSLKLDTPKAYTLFVAGETPDKTFLLEDVFYADTTGAEIRIVNASPIAGAIDVTIGDVTHKNIAFKSATSFFHVSSGKNTLTITQTGSSTPLVTPGPLTLVTGSYYTVYTKGVLNGKGNAAFGARILTTL